MTKNIDVLPAGMGSDQLNEEQNLLATKKIQRQRWMVLVGSFVLVLLPALLVIWTRPPTYQSQAMIHFSYSSAVGSEMPDVPVEQITLNQQRLVSFRVLEQVSQAFAQENYVELSPEQLNEMLSVSADTASRTISLRATGKEAHLLQPLIESWVSLYIDQLGNETADDTQQQSRVLDDKLVALEAKIMQQREQVEGFARDNQIVSEEREENRSLNKIQGLSAALDETLASQADAKARLSSIRQAVANGEVVIHPNDGVEIDRIQSEITTLDAELTALAEVYTEVYMQRDKEIVNKQRNLQGLKVRLEQAKENSQARYIQESELEVRTADDTVAQLQFQLDALEVEAQQFNEVLNTYNRHLEGLTQLEEQSQVLRNQRTELEVQRPLEATIRIIEAPFLPTFPIGPPNTRDSGIALVAATVFSVFCLLLYSFIVRRNTPAQGVTNYTVVAGDPRLVNPELQGLGNAPQATLSHSQSVAKLDAPAPNSQRLLAEQECQEIFDAADPQTKLAMGLMLRGVNENELISLQKSQYSEGTLEMLPPFERAVTVPLPLQELMVHSQGLDTQSVWATPLTSASLEAAIINAAHDAGIDFPDQVNLASLRHTYLTFLVNQGTRLSDLQALSGYTDPSDLAQYRNINRKQDHIEVSEVKIDYPLNWGENE